ncbi:MAG: glycosyltransferase family 4 protein, partial [Candidatus Hadarchaeales archaeon]
GEMALEKTWQGPLYKRVLRRLLFPVYELMELISIKLSNAVFCVSWYSTEKYKKLHLNRNVFRVYNGANVAKISRIKPKRFRKKTIFYMGGFPRWKGVDLLLRAFEIVKKKHPETQLVVMGGCDEEVKYDPELGRLLSKKEGVVWIRYSPHEEAISNLKGAYIAVMPARDAFMTRVISSLKVFEHIAAEIPQVCTDTGEHAEWVRKLDVGIVVKDTPEDIAKGILRLLEDKKLYKRLKENCRKRKWEVDNEIMKKPLIEYLKKLRK